MSTERYRSFEEFWPFYLGEHSNVWNRRLHALGTSLGLITLLAAPLFGQPRFMPLGFVVGYGFAWVGHFLIEKNRPATFSYPAWSFRGDLRMLRLFFTGQLDQELERCRQQGG